VLYTVGLSEFSLGVLLLAVLQFLTSLWISERLKFSLQKEHSAFLENLKWDLKIREQAIRVAEYLALARSLKVDSTESEYRKANQMSWELAMWLPEEVYKEMVNAIAKPNKDANELTTVISVRSLLLQDKAGGLKADDIAHHAPGIGQKT
jgi:hypothetical protein